MTSNHDDEQAWREDRIESDCRIAEDRVADQRAATGGYLVLACIGFVLLAVGDILGEDVLLRVVFAAAGGLALGGGLGMIAWLRGQRVAVGWWRDSLKRTTPAGDPSA